MKGQIYLYSTAFTYHFLSKYIKIMRHDCRVVTALVYQESDLGSIIRRDRIYFSYQFYYEVDHAKMGTTHLSEFSHNWLGRYPKDTHLFTMRKGSGHPISLYYGLEHVKAPTLHIPKTASAKGLP